MILNAIASAVFLYVLYKIWSFSKLDYWQKRGIPGPKPSLIYGNVKEGVLMKKNYGLIYEEIYKRYDNLPYVGIFDLRTPKLLIKDVELIRKILLEDFDYFYANAYEIDEKREPLMGKNPFFLRGEKWKDTRAHLLPAFSEEKAKSAIPNMETVSRRMVQYIRNQREKTFEVKSLSSRVTTDNVFSILYSLDAESFDDSRAEMWKLIKDFFAPSLFKSIRFLILFLVPRLSSILKIRFFPVDFENSLVNLAKDERKQRRENKIVKNDLLDALLEVKFDDVDVAAHSAGFIVDGLETSATALSFLLYEIAANQDVQTQLFHEINSVLEANANVLTPETIHEMTYLDGACQETLRKHPVTFEYQKMCTKDYKVRAPFGGGDFTIERGTAVVIPTASVHMDPKLHPNPEVFNPGRFTPENKERIVRGSYLGFGIGPRMCIGQKLGLMQLKVAVIYLLQRFRLEVDEKTMQPLQTDPLHFLNSAKGGMWIRFIDRYAD